MDYKAQRMSLLAYDLYISKQHMLTNMPEEQKRKEQEKYVQRVINRIKDRVLIGQESRCISVQAMPKQLYPFDKMKKDIMLELKKANINVTRVYNMRRLYDKCIARCFYVHIDISTNHIHYLNSTYNLPISPQLYQRYMDFF